MNDESIGRKKRPYKVYRRMRDLREDKDLTQADMAHMLNCSQRVYSNYERGDVDIPTEVLISLRNYHGTSIDYILELTDIKNPLPNGKNANKLDRFSETE